MYEGNGFHAKLTKNITLILHGTYCVHTSINLRKMKFITNIYTLFLHRFCSLFLKVLLKSCKISGNEMLLTDAFGYYVQQQSL